MTTTESPVKAQGTAGICALILAGSILAIWWVLFHAAKPSPGGPPIPPVIPQPQVIAPHLSKVDFYRQDLAPLLEKSKRSNLLSGDNAVERLHKEFDQFRAGIPAFADDVASWGTRFGLVRRIAKDKWKNFRKGATD